MSNLTFVSLFFNETNKKKYSTLKKEQLFFIVLSLALNIFFFLNFTLEINGISVYRVFVKNIK